MRRSRSRSLLPTYSETRMPVQRRPRRRPDPWRRLARHTSVFELSARLGVNSFLALVAALSLGRLVPHLQAQVQQLEAVRLELDQAEVNHTRLRADFDRYFDPTQSSRVIQEQTGYRSKSERQVVWTY